MRWSRLLYFSHKVSGSVRPAENCLILIADYGFQDHGSDVCFRSIRQRLCIKRRRGIRRTAVGCIVNLHRPGVQGSRRQSNLDVMIVKPVFRGKRNGFRYGSVSKLRLSSVRMSRSEGNKDTDINAIMIKAIFYILTYQIILSFLLK